DWLCAIDQLCLGRCCSGPILDQSDATGAQCGPECDEPRFIGHHYVTRFRYHDGYYDPVEKQFRGFAGAEQVDVGDASAPTLVTHSYFDTGSQFEVMKGKLLRVRTEQEDGKLFSDATTAWTIPPLVLMTGTNGTNVSYVHPVASHTDIVELGHGTPIALESEFDYDYYGNQTRLADYGIVVNGDRSGFDDE